MGCCATKHEVEAIVQRSQDSVQKDQAVHEAKAREQVKDTQRRAEAAAKKDTEAKEKAEAAAAAKASNEAAAAVAAAAAAAAAAAQALKPDKDNLERAFESKELHGQTLADLKEAREPKAAHEELLKAPEELLKAHEHLDDKHLHKVQQIEKSNKELEDQADKIEASVGNQIKELKDELLEALPYLEALPVSLPAQPQPLEEPTPPRLQKNFGLQHWGPECRHAPKCHFKRNLIANNKVICINDNLWTRRYELAQPRRRPVRDQGGPSRLGREVGHPKKDQDDDLKVQSLDGRGGDEEKNPPTVGKDWRQVLADTVQQPQELPQETL